MKDRSVFWCCIVTTSLVIGCTTIDKRVEGWPQDMQVTVHENAGFWKVQQQCWADLPWYWKLVGGIAMQCTTLDISKNTCDIYTISGPASEHELAHCFGGDHDGLLQTYFDKRKG